MEDAILAPGELTVVGQELVDLLGSEGLLVESDCILGNLLQPDASNGANLSTKVAPQQVFSQSDALEYLCAPIRAYGRYSHLAHNLLQSLVDRLDIVCFSSSILLLNLVFLHEIVQNSKSHVRTNGTCPVA